MIEKKQTIRSAINEIIKKLNSVNIPNSRNEAELILEHILKLKRTELYLESGRILINNENDKINEILKNRIKRIPLFYILGSAPFMDWEFKVTPHVLIPRPETELLIEQVLLFISKVNIPAPKILDIGTGSGCIAISLAKSLINSSITAIDISKEALLIAKENACKLDTENKIEFINYDIMQENDNLFFKSSFDIIVSNPPYIKNDEIETLSPELQYEPRTALDGGVDGLNFYRKIFKFIKYLSKNGIIALEIGCDQKEAIYDIVKNISIKTDISTYKDYQGLDRIIIVRRSED